MRAVVVVIASAIGCATLAGATAREPADFAQATRVVGKAPDDLVGVWLLYAKAEFGAGKWSRALAPQIITATSHDGALDLQLHDVQFPKSIYETYASKNQETRAWEPTPADIALLRKDWAKLPPMTNKDWRKSEFDYDRVDFTVVAPDKYGEVFADQTADIREALDGSLFALLMVEKYRPQSIPSGEKIAQPMQRKTIYVMRHASDSVLEGKQFTGYLTAAPGMALPLSVSGPCRLYRLAKGKPSAAPAASPATKPHRSRR